MFSLGTLIQFLKYLRTGNCRFLWLSVFLFVLALGAKGTPAVLPLVLLWLIIQEKQPLRHAVNLIPFGVVVFLYGALLKLAMHRASSPLDGLHFNIGNIVLSFSALFIPEGTLATLNLIVTASLLFVVVSALGLIVIPRKTTAMLRRTGYCILVVALLPVLVLTDFKLATNYSDPYLVLGSPSHRIYLASVGAALLGGGFLRSIETLLRNFSPKFATVAVCMLLTGVVTGNAFLVRERGQLWEYMGDKSRAAFDGMLAYRQHVSKGSQIGLINFPASRAFMTPMIKLCLGVNDLTILKQVNIGVIEDPEILQKAEQSFLFILGSDRHVYDKSQQFRQQLLLNRMAMLNPDRPEYSTACQALATQLDRDIRDILQ